MDLHLNKEIFNFDDTRFKDNLIYKDKLKQKIMHCFKYLENHLPVNKVTKENTFNFNKLKKSEGKNYDWFFLVNPNVKLLVRQYGNHFTLFAINQKAESYFNKLSVFTIHDDLDLLNDDDLHDSYIDNRFKTFETLLPKLFETIEKDRVNGIWNDYSFERPKHTKIKLSLVGDSVSSLDEFIFACDEIFQTFLEKIAENDLLEKLKTLNVGDMFSTYKITDIRTEVKDDYYHAVGLSYVNTNFPNSKEEWSDVYSLTRYHYDEIYFGNSKSIVNDFVMANHETVFEIVFNKLVNARLFISDQITNEYFDEMFKLFSETNKDIDIKTFVKSISKDFNKFIYYSFQMRKNQTK